jgi:hypothetical protein
MDLQSLHVIIDNVIRRLMKPILKVAFLDAVEILRYKCHETGSSAWKQCLHITCNRQISQRNFDLHFIYLSASFFVTSFSHFCTVLHVFCRADDYTAMNCASQISNYYAANWKVAGSRRERNNWVFPSCLILSAALGPGVYSASNRNEYQKQKNVSREYSAAGAQGW